ncbi:hypothetical protein [Streptomyces sp. NPDC058657]|uniref:hypothetical protein n=1 Tax=unclassified Streptomyces TaxID=2593676 RepID=UPI00365361F5
MAANWNLSVDLRGSGQSLAQTLRQNAGHARTLGRAARDAQRDVTALGAASRTTARHVQGLGRTADTSRRHVSALGAAARTTRSHLTQLGGSAHTSAVRLGRLGSQAASAARDLRRLAREAADADAELRALNGSVTLTASLDDQTTGGMTAVQGNLAALQGHGPVRLSATLNDDTGPGAATIRAAVRELQTLSPVRLSATLDDDTGPGVAAVRGALRDLQQLSPVRILTQFDGDPAQAAATAAAIRDIQQNAADARTTLTQLSAGATAAAVALNTAQRAANDLADVLRVLRARAAAAADALDDLAVRALAAVGGLQGLGDAARGADGHLNALSVRTRALGGDLDDLNGRLTRITGGLTGLRGSLTTTAGATDTAGNRMSALIVLAVSLATALLPIAAAAVPIAAGLGAAGVAVGAFGLAIGAQIKHLTDAAEAQTEYEDAVAEHGATSAKAAEADAARQRVLAKMPEPTREAAAAYGVLTDDYKAWSDASAKDTMPVLTKSMGVMGALLPKLSPLVRSTSVELDRMVTLAAGGMATPGFDAFIGKLAKLSARTLHESVDGVVSLSRSLNSFAKGGGFDGFMTYARENGPLVAETLKNVALAVINLIEGLSEVGVSALTVANGFAQLVNAFPPEFIGILVQGYAAFKLLALGASAVTAATGGAAAASLAAFVRSARFGGIAAATTGVVQGMSAMSKGVGIAAAAFAAFYVGQQIGEAFWSKTPLQANQVADAFTALSKTGKLAGIDVDELAGSFVRLSEDTGWTDIVYDYGTFHSNTEWKKAAGDMDAFDKQLATLAGNGNTDLAAEGFKVLSTALAKQGYSTKEVMALLPEYQKTLSNTKLESENAARAAGLFGAQAEATAIKLNTQKASADGLRNAIVALNDANRAALGGMIGFEAAIDAAAKAAAENAGSLRMINGELDLNSPKAQAAATALQDLGTKTDAAATAARENGRSWEYVNGIYDRGTQALITSAMQMGLNRAQATALAQSIIQIPDKHTTNIEMRREDALAGLDSVIAKIKATPGSKSVTVSALTADALQMLHNLGYVTKKLPDGKVQVTARTGAALSGIAAVQAARNALRDRTITITTVEVTSRRSGKPGSQAYRSNKMAQAEGGVVDYYADGGIQRGGVRRFAEGAENHVAQIAPGGTWRVWAEPETEGEGYVPLAPSKRPRSRAITEEIVRRLGGDPAGIAWHADGAVTDWRYDPTTGSLYSASDAGQAGNKTRKVTVKTRDKKGKVTTSSKEVNYFDLGAVERQIKSASKATRGWNNDLATVADRVGTDVADALAAMGKDGVLLTQKMARGSTKYINEMASSLRGLAATARVSLTDYTRQLGKATSADATFARDLATLAGRGYGDLAKQLAAQGDAAAAGLASAAVKDSKKAASANGAARTANRALTNDEVSDLVAIISAVTGPKVGLHDVAESTGLGEDTIVAIATKAAAQIKTALGSRASRFMADLGRAQKGLSYADGGIRAGMYATSGGIVRFAEPETGGEAYIPLSPAKRSSATRVLADVAGRFGKGVTDMRATRPVIVTTGGDTHVTVTAVRTPATATDIGAQVGRSVRRAKRGGVFVRA